MKKINNILILLLIIVLFVSSTAGSVESENTLPVTIIGITANNNVATAMQINVTEVPLKNSRAILAVYESNKLIQMILSDNQLCEQSATGEYEFTFNSGIAYSESQTVKGFVWAMDDNSAFTLELYSQVYVNPKTTNVDLRKQSIKTSELSRFNYFIIHASKCK